MRQWDQQFDAIQRVRTHLEWDKIQHGPTEPGPREQIDDAIDRLYTAAHHETIKRWKDEVSDPSPRRWAEVKIRGATGSTLRYHDLGVDMVSPYPEV